MSAPATPATANAAVYENDAHETSVGAMLRYGWLSYRPRRMLCRASPFLAAPP